MINWLKKLFRRESLVDVQKAARDEAARKRDVALREAAFRERARLDALLAASAHRGRADHAAATRRPARKHPDLAAPYGRSRDASEDMVLAMAAAAYTGTDSMRASLEPETCKAPVSGGGGDFGGGGAEGSWSTPTESSNSTSDSSPPSDP